MSRNNTNRWLSSMLRRLESFQRIADWPAGPRMSLRRRSSPVRWMYDRLFLLERLQPRVGVHLQITTPVLFLNLVTNVAAKRGVEQRSMPPRPPREIVIQTTAAPAPAPRHEIVKGETAPLARSVLQLPARGASLRHPIELGETLRRPSVEAPLTTLLHQRSRRVDELPVDLPARLVRHAAPEPRNMPPQEFSEAARAVAVNPFPRTPATSAWPVPPAPAAPLNVEEITDQVLRQLDRRLIASRERMGRI
jgi:hypothetical protein